MKRTFAYTAITICLLISSKIAPAQVNLIYNGDFEIYDPCPSGYSQAKYCLGWYSPTWATPDYFNACTSWIGVSVPNNGGGYQEAISGVAYCGFIPYVAGYIPGQTAYYCEYIQTKLTEPLQTGKKYRCTYYLSMANESYFASSQIGAYLSVDSVLSGSFAPLDFLPQVCSDYFITDTLNWVKISGTFTANGGESYIAFGHFGDSLLADTLRVRPGNDSVWYYQHLGYYYIEDVSVYLCDDCDSSQLYVPNIFSPNNDGQNDILYVRGRNIRDLQFLIYDRWGELVFESNDVNAGWDGKYMGKACNPAVFVYYVKAIFEDGSEGVKTGNVSLIR